MSQYDLFVSQSPLRIFFRFALPGSLGMLASVFYQITDGIMVAHILGSQAFAALNLAMPFVIVNFSLADLVGVGSSVPISISLGQGKEELADNIFTCACLLIVGLGVMIGAFLYSAAPWIFQMMGAEGEFARLAVRYMRVFAVCSPVTTIVFAADNYLRICGKVKSSMFLNMFMSFTGAGLEFLFIGVMGWGVAGAAFGICLAMMICAVAALTPFIRGKMRLRFRRPRFSWHILWRITACGSPTFLNNVAGRVTSVVMNVMLVRLGGETAVSVYGVLMYAECFIQPLLYGMCDALQPAVGYNWGAGKYSRVRAIEKCCFTASAVLSLSAVTLMSLFPGPIVSLFVMEGNPELLQASEGALRLFCLAYLTRWISFAAQSFMLAVEKVLWGTLISLSVAMIFPLTLMALLRPLGLKGLWLNAPGTSFLAMILALGILWRQRGGFFQDDIAV